MVKSNTVTISNDVDERFRRNISKRTPRIRGDRKMCGDEALTMWSEWVEATGNKEAMAAWAEKWTTMIKA